MKKEKLQLKREHSPLIPGHSYEVIKEGGDYYTISWRGKPINVPKHAFAGSLDWKFVEKDEDEEDFDADFENWNS